MPPTNLTESHRLQRSFDWRGAFWVAAGVPPLVLFSIGGISGVAGGAAIAVWIISMSMGFLQSFTYAEISGMYGSKSGGASVYGALAWLRYKKELAPLSVWCNWFAWSPALSLGCAIGAGYILNAFFPAPAAQSPEVLEWITANAALFGAHSPQVTAYMSAAPQSSLQDAVEAVSVSAAIKALTPPLRTWEALSLGIPGFATLRFNATFFIGAALMCIIYTIQKRGIASTASTQKVLAVIVLVPLFLVGIVPFVTGKIDMMNITNIVPPSSAYKGDSGLWDIGGWTLFLGALYVAAWTTYAFETAACYTAEMKNPAQNAFKAIFFSGLLCAVFFILIPLSFQGVFGAKGMLAPGIADGTGIGEALGSLISPSKVVAQIFVILMILALFLAIMTAMAGASRALYQGAREGWLPSYLSRVNDKGAPINAMRTDFCFNLVLLALASDTEGYFYVLAVSNVGYLIFNFLSLNAGWIHRMDSGHLYRPWKAPALLIGVNTLLAFVNALFLGAGAKVWGYTGALWAGLAFAALAFPIFWYRHYVKDRGLFPEVTLAEVGLTNDNLGERRAGLLPYCALAVGAAIVLWANWFFVVPA